MTGEKKNVTSSWDRFSPWDFCWNLRINSSSFKRGFPDWKAVWLELPAAIFPTPWTALIHGAIRGYLFRAERGEGEKYGRKEDSRRIRLLAEVRSSQILIAKGNFASLVLTVPWRNPTTETCPASGAPCSLFTYICQIRRKQIRPLFHACLTGRIEASRVSM